MADFWLGACPSTFVSTSEDSVHDGEESLETRIKRPGSVAVAINQDGQIPSDAAHGPKISYGRIAVLKKLEKIHTYSVKV